MRFDSIKLRGIGPFPNEVHVDLSSVPGMLVAVTGENGAGKSTLLELFTGALYRTTPTRGKLAALATTRDAFVEVRAVNGHAWTLRQTIDAVSGKGESLVLDAAGAPVLDDAKVTTFDRWASSHLPSPEVLFASIFTAQGAGGFLDMSVSDRKSVLLRALGIEHLEGLAEKARERQRIARADLATVAARIADEQERGGDVAEAEAALAQARAGMVEAGEALTSARADLADAHRAAADLAAAHRDREARLAEREALARRVETAETKRGAIAARLASARGMVEGEARIREAVVELELRAAQAATLTAQFARVEAAMVEASSRKREAFQRQGEASNREATAMARMLQRRHELETEATGIEAAIAQTAARLEKNRTDLLGQADAIRAAVASQTDLTARAQQLALDQARCESDLAQATAGLRRAEADVALTWQRRDAASARSTRLSEILAAEAAVKAAVAELEVARADVAAAESIVREADAALEDVRASRGAGDLVRITRLRTAHEIIRDGANAPSEISALALGDDEHAAGLAESAPQREREALAALATARERMASASRVLTHLERLAARADEMTTARQDLEAAQSDWLEARAAVEALTSNIANARSGVEALRQQRDDLEADVNAVVYELERVRPLAAKAEHLAGAEERIAGYQREIDAARSRLGDVRAKLASLPSDGGAEANEARRDAAREAAAFVEADGALVEAIERDSALYIAREENQAAIERARPLAARLDELVAARAIVDELADQIEAATTDAASLAGQLAALPAIPESIGFPDYSEQERWLADAEREDREAAGRVAVAESKIAAAHEARARLAALDADRQRGGEDLADWTRLADDLGRDGLQAAEIDCAGPELTELVNDLLHTCIGSRWTVTIETQRMSADGKRQIEGCEVRVLDTERGRDANAETLSGGERVLVGEAISLALSMLACRRSGVEGPTLFRDESGAALDPVKGRAYVAMLRRAAEIVGASRVLFVSHTPELQDLADARIHVSGGQVEVMA